MRGYGIMAGKPDGPIAQGEGRLTSEGGAGGRKKGGGDKGVEWRAHAVGLEAPGPIAKGGEGCTASWHFTSRMIEAMSTLVRGRGP